MVVEVAGARLGAVKVRVRLLPLIRESEIGEGARPSALVVAVVLLRSWPPPADRVAVMITPPSGPARRWR
jgi:hypothetical protein